VLVVIFNLLRRERVLSIDMIEMTIVVLLILSIRSILFLYNYVV